MAQPQALASQPECLATVFAARAADVAIIRNGYLRFSIDESYMRPRFQAVIDGMKLLTETPDAEQIFQWRAHREDCYGKGYEQEVGVKFSHDDEIKWKLQHTVGALAEELEKPAAAPFRPLVQALDDIHDEAFKVGLALAKCFDASNRRRDGKKKYRGSLVAKLEHGICITRVLRYVAGGQRMLRTMQAKAHFDRDFLTPHWFSTDPGLEMRDTNGEWVKAEETSADSAIIFPGEKFGACTDGIFNTFGTAHGVWSDKPPEKDRYAIVSFLHPRPDPEEAQWLLSRKPEIEAFEATLKR